MEKIFNTQDKCADFVRHFSLHMLYFFHILPVISSLADILLLLSFLMVLNFSILQSVQKMPIIPFLVLCV